MYNELLDSETIHANDKVVTGKPFHIPLGLSEPIPLENGQSERRSFGGHESTALESINFIMVDYEGVAERNLAHIRENIAREKAYQEKSDLTPVL
jgi:hypothetical protein